MQSHRVTSLETARSLANGPSFGLKGKYVFCVPRESKRLLSLFCLWEKSAGRAQRRGNSLYWKANKLPLFSIMTLCIDAVTTHQWGERWLQLPLAQWEADVRSPDRKTRNEFQNSKHCMKKRNKFIKYKPILRIIKIRLKSKTLFKVYKILHNAQYKQSKREVCQKKEKKRNYLLSSITLRCETYLWWNLQTSEMKPTYDETYFIFHFTLP